jgi:hypothetical protein
MCTAAVKSGPSPAVHSRRSGVTLRPGTDHGSLPALNMPLARKYPPLWLDLLHKPKSTRLYTPRQKDLLCALAAG